MRVSVIGLGRLGTPLAACLAASGCEVIGTDVSPEVVERRNAGVPGILEPGLESLLARVLADRTFRAVPDPFEAVRGTEVSFIAVQTPSESDGSFSLDSVLPALKAVGEAIGCAQGRHLVVLSSTVSPGQTLGRVLPALEDRSGRRCGRDFGLCYSPEFIALGSAVRNLRRPDFLLIGESDPLSGETLARVRGSMCQNAPPVCRTKFINAELAKLAVNSFLTTRISFANMIGRICERMPGASADAVTEAMGLDRRIGPAYLRAGAPFGGPCFPRDNRALGAVARELGLRAPIARAADLVNRSQIRHLAGLVLASLPPQGTASLLGLAYKAGTPVVDESLGIALAQALLAGDRDVLVHDPIAVEGARAILGDRVRYAPSIGAAIRADVIVVATPHPEYANLHALDLNPAATVIDPWRAVAGDRLPRSVRYVPVGRSLSWASG